MDYYETYFKQFGNLLGKGKDILHHAGWDGHKFPHNHPPDEDFHKWYVSSKNLIEKVCGKDSVHFKTIDELYTKHSGNSYFMPACLGVLQSASDDFEGGLLNEVQDFIRAEVFSDFIEQAEYLFDQGFLLPAAVLARAVLENALRQLCMRSDITIKKDSKLDFMNAELAKKSVYNRNVQKQITAFAAIGNSAAHGKLDEFKSHDVDQMIKGIINFNATYLT
jgi:hypothetical protein